ncbi:uncharacterized protein LOC121534765 [Coregonus clupeaformis]|uniref:uncharacterized protein LOC121534765 n=2 Tax=Coregonus clupeaformis TaxID=59861 RepID=UPI001E1C7B27|nr:uncharacterized protein LOC121534765 [Coregonus clupeaformis]
MSRSMFSRLLTATPLRFLRERSLLCAAGLLFATGSAVYFYSKYYGIGEDALATVESVDRVVTVEEDNEPTLDQEDPVLVQYVVEEVGHRPCLALIPWSGPLWVPSSPTYYLTHAGRMLVRELAVLNTQIFTVEQPIFICFTPARRMVWNELSSQNEQYVDEEVGHRSCLALIPWSGPLCVPIFPVFSKAKPVYYLTRAGRMLVTELAVLNTQTSKLVIEEPTIHLTEAGRLVLDELSAPSDSHSQPNREDSGFPYEKLQLVGNWGSFHFHYWKIHYRRVQQNEEDMHHLCIVRGVEKQLWWSRVIQEKILDPWGLVQVVLTNNKVTGIKFLGRRIHGLMSCLVKRRSEFTYYEDAQQVDISTTVEGYQERGDEMMAYQFSTSDIITTPHEPSSGSSHQFPQNSPPPPFPSDSPPSPPPPYHSTQDQDQTPDSTPQEFEEEFVEEQNNAADVPQLRRYFENQGTTNFSLRLAGIRRAMEALTSSDSTSLNYLTHAGRMVLSGLSELNQQDVRQFQQAYDLLVNFINEPANRERLEQEMALVGIDRINFADVFYEFVLLSLLEGKTSLPISKPGSFLYLLLQVIMRIDPPGGAWTEAAENFYLLVKGQMKAWLESIFNLNESIYESPERLSGEVMGNLEIQVEFLLSSLD